MRILIAVLCLTAPATAQIVYVDGSATGAGTGVSWADAYTELRDALAATATGEIWVAAGIYAPAPPGGSRGDSFHLKSGVQIYGGFTGVESQRGQRDPQAHPTILSADIDGDDNQPGANPFGNSWHVVDGSGTDATALLDGFVVTAAWATAISGVGFGGGLLINNGSPTIRNCDFQANTASYGGAAAMIFGGGTATFEDCRFTGNRGGASSRGGALHVASGCGAVLRRCVFEFNSAEHHGGAIYKDFGASLVAEECLFHGNSSNPVGSCNAPYGCDGGAILAGSQGSLQLTRCSFLDNVAGGGNGGAVYTYADGTIADCVFIRNQVYQTPAAVGAVGGYGGALVSSAANLTIERCTFYANQATEDTGGILGSATTVLTDSILWGNSDVHGSVSKSQVSGCNKSYLCVQNMLVGIPGEDPPDPFDFPGSIDADPQFTDPFGPDGILGTPDDDVRLTAASPCIDAGRPASFPFALSDRAGGQRWLDGDLDGSARVDMGAHEFTNVDLGVTTTQTPTGTTITASVGGTPGLPCYLAAGTAGLPAPVSSFGALLLDATQPVIAVPLGTSPASIAVQFPAASPPVVFRLQALVLSGAAGNLSEAVDVAAP